MSLILYPHYLFSVLQAMLQVTMWALSYCLRNHCLLWLFDILFVTTENLFDQILLNCRVGLLFPIEKIIKSRQLLFYVLIILKRTSFLKIKMPQS